MSSIGVLGAGTWGMALARMLANSGHDVAVWSALGYEIDDLSATRKHPKLPGWLVVTVPEDMRFKAFYVEEDKFAIDSKSMELEYNSNNLFFEVSKSSLVISLSFNLNNLSLIFTI